MLYWPWCFGEPETQFALSMTPDQTNSCKKLRALARSALFWVGKASLRRSLADGEALDMHDEHMRVGRADVVLDGKAGADTAGGRFEPRIDHAA